MKTCLARFSVHPTDPDAIPLETLCELPPSLCIGRVGGIDWHGEPPSP
jgi:hypothetical protein